MKKLLKVISILTLLIFLRTNFALCAEQVYFYHTDPAGTPLAMSDASGTVVWRANYLPFGEEMIDQSTVQNNKMFVGKEKDSESGLYYFGARYMDPGAGRFIATDPIGPVDPKTGRVNSTLLSNPQRMNLYAYAGNNPYKFMDPDGKWMLIIEFNKKAQYGSLALVWNGLLPDGIFAMKTRADSKGANAAAASGVYDYSLDTHKGSYFAEHDALKINDGNKITTEGPNIAHNGASEADGIFSHAGNPERANNSGSSGSRGCWTVPVYTGEKPEGYSKENPTTWTNYNNFISSFQDHPEGKALLLRLDSSQ